MLIQDGLHPEVQLATWPNTIEFRFAQNAARGGLGLLRSGVKKIGDLGHGRTRIQNTEPITALTFTVTLSRVTTPRAGTSSASTCILRMDWQSWSGAGRYANCPR